MARKLAAKLAAPKKIKQPHGGALLSGGIPGHPGTGGRPANWLKEFCDDLLADPKCKAEVRAVLKDRKHPAFSSMWAKVSDRAHGRPVQPISFPDPASMTPEQLRAAAAAIRSRVGG